MGQQRPFAVPLARPCPHALLEWAHGEGLIELNPDGSWYFSEAALQWLSHQPLTPRRGPDRDRNPERCDA